MPASTFLSILHAIASNDSIGIVHFGSDGSGLIITHVKLFEQQVLPANFSTTKFASFLRSLSYYGVRHNAL